MCLYTRELDGVSFCKFVINTGRYVYTCAYSLKYRHNYYMCLYTINIAYACVHVNTSAAVGVRKQHQLTCTGGT